MLRFVYWSGLEGKLLVVQPRRATRCGQGGGALAMSLHVQPRNVKELACTQGQPDQGASTVLRFVYWRGLEGKLLVVQPRRATRWGQGEEAIPTRRHVQPRNVKELGLYSRST